MFFIHEKVRFAVFFMFIAINAFSMIFILICFLVVDTSKLKNLYYSMVFIFYFLSSFVLRSVLPNFIYGSR